jgi:polyisoprenoid-binding protein YceI
MKYKNWLYLIFAFFSSLSCQYEAKNDKITESSFDVLSNGTIHKVDTVQSILTWIVSTDRAKYDGTIRLADSSILTLTSDNTFAGYLNLKLDSIKISRWNFSDTSAQSIIKQVTSEKFLNTQQYPLAILKVSSLTNFDENWVPPSGTEEHDSPFQPEGFSEFMLPQPSHLLNGSLTINGITNKITAPTKLKISEQQITLEAKFNIDRSEWNINSFNKPDNDFFVFNTINIGLYLEAHVSDD